MQYMVNTLTIGGLIHDLGKINITPGGGVDGRAHSVSGGECVGKYTRERSILDCVRYHRHQDLEGAALDAASLAYLVYLADSIASGVDRRPIEGAATGGFNKSRPQELFYNLLNNNNGRAVHRATASGEKINL